MRDSSNAPTVASDLAVRGADIDVRHEGATGGGAHPLAEEEVVAGVEGVDPQRPHGDPDLQLHLLHAGEGRRIYVGCLGLLQVLLELLRLVGTAHGAADEHNLAGFDHLERGAGKQSLDAVPNRVGVRANHDRRCQVFCSSSLQRIRSVVPTLRPWTSTCSSVSTGTSAIFGSVTATRTVGQGALMTVERLTTRVISSSAEPGCAAGAGSGATLSMMTPNQVQK